MEQKNEQTKDAENRLYELGYVLISAIPEDKVASEVTKIKDAITERGCSVEASADPSLRDLAYPMSLSKEHKKTTYTAGYFGWVVFDGEPEAAVAIDDMMKKSETVLRYLLIKRPPLSVNAAVRTFAPGVGARKDAKKAKEDVNEEELDKTIEELVEEKVEA